MFRFRSAKIGDVTVDEVDGLSTSQASLLAERGLVFATSFTKDGKAYGGSIIAASEKDAEEIAGKRGLGEEIIGLWVWQTAA